MKKENMIQSILVEIGWSDAQYESGPCNSKGIEVYIFNAKDDGNTIQIRVDVLGDYALIFTKHHVRQEWEYQGYETVRCYHNSGNIESIPVADGQDTITVCHDCSNEI